MKKKFVLMVLLSFVIMCFAGCNNGSYRLIKIKGDYYIELGDKVDNLPSDSNIGGSMLAPDIWFSSFEEMITDITNGNFTEEELYELARAEKLARARKQEKIKICDIENLYEPKDSISFSYYRIQWSIDSASYSLQLYSEDGDGFAFLVPAQEKEFNEHVEKYQNGTFSGVIEGAGYPDEERDATVYICNRAGVTGKHVVYSWERYGESFYVWENYSQLEDALPVSIEMYCTSEGEFLRVYFSRPDELPSIDDLSQYGLQKYVPTEES